MTNTEKQSSCLVCFGGIGGHKEDIVYFVREVVRLVERVPAY